MLSGIGGYMSVKLLKIAEVVEKTGFCRATIYNKMREGQFPRPADLGGRGRRWLESKVDEFLIEKSDLAQT